MVQLQSRLWDALGDALGCFGRISVADSVSRAFISFHSSNVFQQCFVGACWKSGWWRDPLGLVDPRIDCCYGHGCVVPQVTVGEMALSLSIVDGDGLREMGFSRENPAANAVVGTAKGWQFSTMLSQRWGHGFHGQASFI